MTLSLYQLRLHQMVRNSWSLLNASVFASLLRVNGSSGSTLVYSLGCSIAVLGI